MQILHSSFGSVQSGSGDEHADSESAGADGGGSGFDIDVGECHGPAAGNGEAYNGGGDSTGDEADNESADAEEGGSGDTVMLRRVALRAMTMDLLRAMERVILRTMRQIRRLSWSVLHFFRLHVRHDLLICKLVLFDTYRMP